MDNKTNVNNIFGEKITPDRLITMDDVSDLADKSKTFASFLTVARKYGYSCVYIFYTIFQEKAVWRSTSSQAKIYNIFPATVLLPSVLETACSRKTIKYILQNALSLNRRFIELADRDDRLCLTIDCSGINKDSPGRFRNEADNPEFQTCYFNSAKDEQVYKKFVSKRIKSIEDGENFHFKIIKLQTRTNKNVIFDTADELSNLNNNGTAANRSDKKSKISFRHWKWNRKHGLWKWNKSK